MKNLIVNADDLGWTEGVNRGIAECHRNGIVTSASLLANGAAFEPAVELAKSLPGLGIGVHLNLSDGAPLAGPARTMSNIILNDGGEFDGGPEKLLLKMLSSRPAMHALALSDIEFEWNLQIRRVLDAGISPTHLDGHKHVQMLPGLFDIALRLAKQYEIRSIRISHEASKLRAALSTGTRRPTAVLKQGLQARGLRLLARDARKEADQAGIATADYFCGIAQTGALTKEGTVELLSGLPEGTTELMCHPGYADNELKNTATRLQESREKEIGILTDAEVRNIVASQGIRLIDYGFVSRRA